MSASASALAAGGYIYPGKPTGYDGFFSATSFAVSVSAYSHNWHESNGTTHARSPRIVFVSAIGHGGIFVYVHWQVRSTERVVG